MKHERRTNVRYTQWIWVWFANFVEIPRRTSGLISNASMHVMEFAPLQELPINWKCAFGSICNNFAKYALQTSFYHHITSLALWLSICWLFLLFAPAQSICMRARVLCVYVCVCSSVSVLLATLIIIFNFPYPSLRHRNHEAKIAPSMLVSGSFDMASYHFIKT